MERRYYSVINTNQDKYKWMIIATSHVSPLSVLDDVEKDLNGYSGDVLFDMTLINGTESNRYITAAIDKGVFKRSSIKAVNGITPDLSKMSRKFFADNPEIVDDSVIPKSLKYLLKQGAPL